MNSCNFTISIGVLKSGTNTMCVFKHLIHITLINLKRNWLLETNHITILAPCKSSQNYIKVFSPKSVKQ